MKFKSSSFIKKVGVLLCFVAFALSANAQTRKVTGQIVDESGQPIIGATIRLQDATTGPIFYLLSRKQKEKEVRRTWATQRLYRNGGIIWQISWK